MVSTTRKLKLGPPLVVQHDDVCLGLVGKASTCTWWPLRVQGSGHDPAVDVIFFGDSKTGRLARNKLRPFADLEEIPSRFIPKSTAYQNAIKEATEWLETAQSSDEPTSHDLDPAATLPRLEFVSEAQVAAASKLLDMGGTGAGGAATHARLASLPQPSFRFVTAEVTTAAAEPECSVSSPAAVERIDDLSFAARHAPYEMLERRGFAAHPCAAREFEQRQTSSGGATKKASSLTSAEELRRRQVEAARLPDGGKQLGSAVAAQLVGQRLLVPTHVFGDAPSNFVFDGIVRRRTRGRASCVDVTFWVDGKTESFDAMQALEWVDLGAAVLERGSSAGPVPFWPLPASQPLVAAPGAQPKTSGRKTWLETPRHDKWLAQ